MNWYKRYPGDFMRDTAHLSLAERGAYTALLDHYYASGEPLPGDMRTLCRIAGAQDEDELRAVRRVVAEFFPMNGDGTRHNTRADKELAKAKAKSESRRKAAESRWQDRR